MARALIVIGLLLGSGCGDRGVDCTLLCERAATCRLEVGEALVGALPERSPAMQEVRRELGARLLHRVLESCQERCRVLSRARRWREALRQCRTKEPCSRFGPCIAPLLNP